MFTLYLRTVTYFVLVLAKFIIYLFSVYGNPTCQAYKKKNNLNFYLLKFT